jgi:hypothetical protein
LTEFVKRKEKGQKNQAAENTLGHKKRKSRRRNEREKQRAKGVFSQAKRLKPLIPLSPPDIIICKFSKTLAGALLPSKVSGSCSLNYFYIII